MVIIILWQNAISTSIANIESIIIVKEKKKNQINELIGPNIDSQGRGFCNQI
jgi:hypothetical protein